MAKKDVEKAPIEEEEDADEREDEEEDEDESDSEDASDEEESDEEDADEDDDDEDDADEEGSDDDEEDDEDDEDDQAAEAKGLHDHAVPAPEPEDPSWWLPHLVLGLLVTVGVLGFFGVFNKFLRPIFHKDEAAAETSSAPPASSAPTHAATPPPPPMPTQKAPDAPMYGAKHLVVQYKGSARAPTTVTRSKEDAKTRAEEALKKIKGGAKFEDVVGEYSDEPGAKERGGDLGRFRAGTFDPKFVEAVQGMKVGDVSGVVETQFGYHIILRTQ